MVGFHREAADGAETWRPFPVEYKRGRPRPGGADEVQLCAQAICPEEMLGLAVPRGVLFHGTTRRRRPIDFTPALRARVESAARRCHELFDGRVTPRVARDRRSLLDLCLPAVTGGPPRADLDPAELIRTTPAPEEPG